MPGAEDFDAMPTAHKERLSADDLGIPEPIPDWGPSAQTMPRAIAAPQVAARPAPAQGSYGSLREEPEQQTVVLQRQTPPAGLALPSAPTMAKVQIHADLPDLAFDDHIHIEETRILPRLQMDALAPPPPANLGRGGLHEASTQILDARNLPPELQQLLQKRGAALAAAQAPASSPAGQRSLPPPSSLPAKMPSLELTPLDADFHEASTAYLDWSPLSTEHGAELPMPDPSSMNALGGVGQRLATPPRIAAAGPPPAAPTPRPVTVPPVSTRPVTAPPVSSRPVTAPPVSSRPATVPPVIEEAAHTIPEPEPELELPPPPSRAPAALAPNRVPLGPQQPMVPPRSATGMQQPISPPRSATGMQQPISPPRSATGMQQPISPPRSATGMQQPISPPRSATGMQQPISPPRSATGCSSRSRRRGPRRGCSSRSRRRDRQRGCSNRSRRPDRRRGCSSRSRRRDRRRECSSRSHRPGRQRECSSRSHHVRRRECSSRCPCGRLRGSCNLSPGRGRPMGARLLM